MRSTARTNLVLSALIVTFVGAAAHAQDGPSDDERLRSLEAQAEHLHDEIQDLRARVEGEAGAAAQGADFQSKWGKDVVFTWKDGFEVYYLDPDEQDPVNKPLHGFGVHGRLHFGYRVYADDAHPIADTFRTRRARLQAKGFFFRHIAWAVEAEFARDEQTRLRDGWINLGWWKPLQVRIGNIKSFSSLEMRVSSNHLNFVERPMFIGVMGIDYDLGAMVHGDLEYLIYHLGVFNGNNINDTDNDQSKGIAAHVLFMPFRPAKTPVLEGLGLGGSFSYGHRKDFSPSFKSISGVRWLDFDEADSGFQKGGFQRVGAEVLLAAGPLRLQAEYMYMRLRGFTAGNGMEGDLDVNTLSLDALFMLTGEDHKLSKRVTPKRNFDPLAGGWGAWQIGFRYEAVDVESAFVRKAADRGTDRMDAYTVGVNWYLNPYLKFQTNYIRVEYDDDTGVDNVQRNEDVFITHFVISF